MLPTLAERESAGKADVHCVVAPYDSNLLHYARCEQGSFGEIFSRDVCHVLFVSSKESSFGLYMVGYTTTQLAALAQCEKQAGCGLRISGYYHDYPHPAGSVRFRFQHIAFAPLFTSEQPVCIQLLQPAFAANFCSQLL